MSDRDALLWSTSSRQRVLVVSALGALSALAAVWFAPWQLTVLIGWDMAAAVFVAWVWLSVRSFTPDQTKELATREDDSRTGAELLLVAASLASLLGVGFALAKAKDSSGFEHTILTAIALLTVFLSWMTVNINYAFRYAHEFYAPPLGGVDFKSKEPPDYQDFAYVAFTVGMTFQVSDTDIQRQVVRRTVLRHALLSYLFGAVILAVTINVVANLFQ